MGIRINKVMGWGLVFPLHEMDSVITETAQQQYDLDFSTKAYKEFLSNKYKLNLDDADEVVAQVGKTLNMDTVFFPEGKELTHTFTLLDDEYDNNAVVILTPAGAPEWVRKDDSIDYAESELAITEGSAEQNTDTIIRYQRYNQYPYSGSYMDANTGERFDHKGVMTLRTLRNGLLEVEAELSRLKEAGKAAETLTLDEFATSEAMQDIFISYGFTGNQDFLDRFVPYVPQEIRDIAEHLNIFTEPGTVIKLRPMLAQFWR